MARKQRPRELIQPNPGDKRYIRRDSRGRFTTDQVDVSKSLSTDARKRAQRAVKRGYGDQGDRKR